MKSDDLSLIPEGWIKAFGYDIIQDLNRADKCIEIIDAKEKWGELRLTVYPYSHAASDVCEKYREISRHICIKCGKPDVPMLDFGWVSPICEDCFPTHIHKDYKECIVSNKPCPNNVLVERYDPQWEDDTCTERVNLTEEMRRIRRRYIKRVEDSNASADVTADVRDRGS